MTRRIIVVALGAALALSANMPVPASAGTVVAETYGSPALGQGDVLSACLAGDSPLDSCVVIPVPAGARGVRIWIEDASGTPTYFTVGMALNDDGLTHQAIKACQSSPHIPLAPPVLGVHELTVFPHALPGLGNDFASPCLGVGTTGTVYAEFS